MQADRSADDFHSTWNEEQTTKFDRLKQRLSNYALRLKELTEEQQGQEVMKEEAEESTRLEKVKVKSKRLLL